MMMILSHSPMNMPPSLFSTTLLKASWRLGTSCERTDRKVQALRPQARCGGDDASHSRTRLPLYNSRRLDGLAPLLSVQELRSQQEEFRVHRTFKAQGALHNTQERGKHMNFLKRLEQRVEAPKATVAVLLDKPQCSLREPLTGKIQVTPSRPNAWKISCGTERKPS